MSPFEAGCLTWYMETVTPFTLEAGIVAESFRALRLRGAALRIFTIAVDKIHDAQPKGAAEGEPPSQT